MSRIRFVTFLSALVLTFVSTLYASPITYAVGKCRPDLRSFHTISRALAAAPSADVIEVCPGTYNEQVQITHPITLEGVISDDSAQAIIAPPIGGLVINARNDLGQPVAAQLWVNNASELVNVGNLTMDASGNGVSGALVVGIFYHNSNGTVNRVTTRNQSGDGGGIGIFVEGGSSNPLVTIENNSIHDYDQTGIEVETNSATPELTAVIKGNALTSPSANQAGLFLGTGSAVTVTNNLILNPLNGLGIEVSSGSAGSISGNTVLNAFRGIQVEADDVSVTSNKIFGSGSAASEGIGLLSSGVHAVQGNSIINSFIGIDFGCSPNPSVRSNIIMDASFGLLDVPSGTVLPSNTYFNVNTIRSTRC